MKKKLSLILLAVICVVLPTMASIASAAPAFADPNFQKVWERTDKILTERVNIGRGYIWGPESIFNGQETYTEATGSKRTVQYFDKARMEVNNPGGNRNDDNFVTSGLLVKELVLGRQQNGDNVTNFSQGTPSEVQIAGDPNTGGQNAVAPTYRSFRNVATFNNDNPVDSKLGQAVTQKIDKAGMVSTITSPDGSVAITAYESSTKHNIANVFVAYGNSQGLIWTGSAYINGPLFFPNATYVFGLPITDPYWVRAVVGGTEKDVLVQLFERRVLTYTPTNDANNKVEMGNVGAHYYRWRYQENGGGTVTPPPPPPPPTPSSDYSQFRAPYLKSGSVPQGGSANVSSYPTGGSAINSSPVYDPDKKLAIIGTAAGGLVAVNTTNLSSLSQAWKYQPTTVNFNSPVVLFNGTVYVGGSDGKVYAVKETDGTLVWASSATGGAVTSQIALDIDTAYFTSADGKLYAINLSNGTPKWQVQPSGVNLTYSPVFGSDGTLYVSGADNKVYAYKKDGTPNSSWTAPTFDAPVSATAAFGNGRLYVGTANGKFYSLNTNGTIQSQTTFTLGKAIQTTPAIVTVGANIRAYVGTDDGKVYGVDANNVASTQWTFNVGSVVVRSSPAIVDGFVYFGADDKNVYRVEAANQSNVALIAGPAGSTFGTNSPVVNSGLVIIPSQEGVLHVIK